MDSKALPGTQCLSFEQEQFMDSMQSFLERNQRDQELAKSERDKYTRVWMEPNYRHSSPGLRNMDRIIEALDLQPSMAFIDFGSGGGVTLSALRGLGFLRGIGVDIAANANMVPHLPVIITPIHEMPMITGVDVGYCVDVMEHIPEEWVYRTLAKIASCAKECYFRIALFEDSYGQTLGVGPLHMTVRQPEWWLEQLRKPFLRVELQEAGEPNILAVLCSRD
jgi:hypothetical protein